MAEVTRRDCLQGTLAMLAAGGVPASKARAAEPPASGVGLIKLAEVPIGNDPTYALHRQMGVTHAVPGAGLSNIPPARYLETLTRMMEAHKKAGMTVAACEGGTPPLRKSVLGQPGRDEEIQNWILALEAMGKVGIPVISWGWGTGLGWYRTKQDVVTRGGALTMEFDNGDAKKLGLTEAGEISRDMLWETFTYFMKAVIPAAEKANVKMGFHPSDPPLSPLRGLGRIATSRADYYRIIDTVPSPVNGITFCQGNFSAMAGDSVYEMAEEFCKRKKVFFVHYRNIDGDREHFVEKFHDDGQIDMPRIMKIYSDNGFVGPMRPDHAPIMFGEKNDRPGYGASGKIFAFGYMKGILDALKIPYV